MRISVSAQLAAILCLGVVGFPTGSTSGQDIDMTAKACTADSGQNRAFCVAMIGGTRQMLSDGKVVCSPASLNDLSDTYAVIDFIRAHPERQGEKIGAITEEVLKKLHPCP
jgi:hypothetical protein